MNKILYRGKIIDENDYLIKIYNSTKRLHHYAYVFILLTLDLDNGGLKWNIYLFKEIRM